MGALFDASDSSGDRTPKDPQAFFGPGAVDQQIRQAISCCWMMLPGDKKSVASLESEIRRLVDRALEDLKEDGRAFGISTGD